MGDDATGWTPHLAEKKRKKRDSDAPEQPKAKSRIRTDAS